jgi:HEAT repeat protein
LVRALTDKSFPVRWQAAQSLGFVVGRDDKAQKIAVPGLVVALKDKVVDIRIAAGLSLALIGQGELAVPVMTTAIREGRDKSGEAQLALGLSGSCDKAALEALVSASSGSSYPKIRQESKASLDRFAVHILQP